MGQLPPVAVGGAGVALPAPTDPFLEARSALQNFGLSLREAEDALRGAPEGATVEELLRFALNRERSAS